MASFTELDTNGLLPGEPWTSGKALAVYENPLAMFEGASGAPRLHGDAVGTVFNLGLPVLSVTAGAAFAASTDSFITTFGDTTTSSATNVVAISYENKLYTGSMRFFLEHRSNTPGAPEESIVDIFKNGGLVTTFTTSGDTPIGVSADISIVPDDNVTWAHRAAGGGDSILTNIAVAADDAYQLVTPLARASQLVP